MYIKEKQDFSRYKEDVVLIRNGSVMKRKRLGVIILSLVVGICLIAQPMAAFAEVLTSTVDNSVDKSSTRVMGVLKLTGCLGDTTLVDQLTVYDSEKVKVAYSNPTNDYVQSLIDKAREKTERLGHAAVEGFAGERTLKPAVTEKTESSYDNRVYTWVKDNESDDDVIIGEPGGGTVGNQNRHMVIDGDYARTTVYTVTVEIVFPDHVWDAGEVTKEATETEEGVKTFTCTVCKGTKTESIPKLEKDYILGDVDGNGYIEAADARLALRASVGLETLSDEQTVIADVDGSGEIGSDDARLILRASVGLEDPETWKKA